MDRLTFFDMLSISDPILVVSFYDQFLVLNLLLGDSPGTPIVDSYNDTSIRFSVLFSTAKDKKEILSRISSGSMVMYGKPISVQIEDSSTKEIIITMDK
jgi:hypothetical protein